MGKKKLNMQRKTRNHGNGQPSDLVPYTPKSPTEARNILKKVTPATRALLSALPIEAEAAIGAHSYLLGAKDMARHYDLANEIYHEVRNCHQRLQAKIVKLDTLVEALPADKQLRDSIGSNYHETLRTALDDFSEWWGLIRMICAQIKLPDPGDLQTARPDISQSVNARIDALERSDMAALRKIPPLDMETIVNPIAKPGRKSKRTPATYRLQSAWIATKMAHPDADPAAIRDMLLSGLGTHTFKDGWQPRPDLIGIEREMFDRLNSTTARTRPRQFSAELLGENAD